MRNAALLLVVFLLGGCMVRLPAASGGPQGPGGEGATATASTLEREIHSRVNEYRASRGLPPLTFDVRVAEIARSHSAAMASGRRPFSHEGFEQRTQAVLAVIPSARAFAENVAYDSRTGPRLAELVVQGWIQSSEHRENLEGPYQITGIGVAVAPNGWRYFTQLFVGAGR
jgi:uncharacterized protein YkwD